MARTLGKGPVVAATGGRPAVRRLRRRGRGWRRSRGSRSSGSACRSAAPARRRRGGRRTARWRRPRRSARTSSGSSAAAVDAVGQPLGEGGARQLRHALHLGEVGDRHDPGHDRLVAAQRRQLVDQAQVVLGLEEELGDGEVGPLQLGGQVATVARPGRASGGAARGGRPRRRRSRPASGHVLEQLGGVGVVARAGVGGVRRAGRRRGPGCSRCRLPGRPPGCRRSRPGCAPGR